MTTRAPPPGRGNGAQVHKPRGRTVSRVLFGSEDPDGHLSGMVVADHLKQPTRGYPVSGGTVRAAPRRLFGLAPTGGYRATDRCRQCGGLLPHHFTLTLGRGLGRFAFCCPVRRLAAPRRYLAVCPVELGLSSGRCEIARDHRVQPHKEYNRDHPNALTPGPSPAGRERGVISVRDWPRWTEGGLAPPDESTESTTKSTRDTRTEGRGHASSPCSG